MFYFPDQAWRLHPAEFTGEKLDKNRSAMLHQLNGFYNIVNTFFYSKLFRDYKFIRKMLGLALNNCESNRKLGYFLLIKLAMFLLLYVYLTRTDIFTMNTKWSDFGIKAGFIHIPLVIFSLMDKLKKSYFVQSILIISGAYRKGELALKHNDGFLTIGGSRRCTKDVGGAPRSNLFHFYAVFSKNLGQIIILDSPLLTIKIRIAK